MTERAVQAMISDNYLDSMIRAVRRSKTDAVAGEITDLILEARADMIGAGFLQKRQITRKTRW